MTMLQQNRDQVERATGRTRLERQESRDRRTGLFPWRSGGDAPGRACRGGSFRGPRGHALTICAASVGYGDTLGGRPGYVPDS